ncbi:MAG TPA: ATP-binding protein [Acetobacteraceae bacterium]
MDNILEVVCRTTGMGFAAVARVTEDRWVACRVRDEIAFGMKPGGELKVETTICSAVRNARLGVFIDNVAEDATYCGHPTPALYGFQSYISMPIVLKDGTFFGTLCAIDPRPARVSTPETIGMFRLFAELIALHLDAFGRVEVLEQRVAERTAERDLLAEIVGATDVMIMACDLDYTILAINKANADEFERIYGVRPKVGDNMLELLADQPEHQAQVRAGWGRGLSGEEGTLVEDYGDPGRARPYYEVRFRTLWNRRGERVGCYQFVTDVTGRLREQAALAAVQEALRQSQKMEAVGQLTGGLAHDFNNLLTGITGSLELLGTRLAQGRIGEVDRYVAAAQGAAKRAASLTHRLLAFSRRQTLDPKPTDMNRLVAGMEELVRRTMGPAVVVEVVGVTELWTTLVDPGQLESALLNLCINARDAMPDGGKITVETGNRWLDERTARARELPTGQYVSLCVSDTGVGMPAEVMARAFDPFFTTKPIGMGTGLGLSMVYGFVRQSGGQAHITSKPGQGTTVCLYLPCYLGMAEDVDGAAVAAEAPRAGRGETVLVVDDEPTVRMLMTEVLEDLGYTVIEAADGPAGLWVLQSDARVDLLVTDVGLPGGMNGRQVADAARMVRPGLKVLFITGYAENAVLSHGQLEAGMHVLTKPFAMEALARRITTLVVGT